MLILCALCAPAANALTFNEVELVCPVDGEKFTATLAGSGTTFGRYLDLKPYGPTAAPWPLAKCPTSGFVMYKQKFSDDEISQFRKYVASGEYKALKDANTNYYLAAKLRASQGEKPPQIAYTLLQATWEAKSFPQYQQYATEALDAYKAAVADTTTDPKQWVHNQFVAGELERRLGRLDDSKARFKSLADREEAKTGMFPVILDLQLQLIEAKNTQPQQIPRRNDAKK